MRRGGGTSGRRALGTGLAVLALALAAGCSDAPATAPATDPAPPATVPTGAPATAVVYFLDDAGRLVAERRRVAGPLDARSALEALAKGPRGAGLVPALPAGTAVRGVRVDDGIATADFSGEFERGYPSGGAAAETAVLAPIIYTVTGVPGVRRVRITVEGRTPEPPGSQVGFAAALSRADLPVTVVRRP